MLVLVIRCPWMSITRMRLVFVMRLNGSLLGWAFVLVMMMWMIVIPMCLGRLVVVVGSGGRGPQGGDEHPWELEARRGGVQHVRLSRLGGTSDAARPDP